MCCGEHAALGSQRIALRLAGHGGAHRCVADKGGRSFAADFVAAGFGRCSGCVREYRRATQGQRHEGEQTSVWGTESV
jgi:hypothetical protein